MGPVAVFQTSRPHPLVIFALSIVTVVAVGLASAKRWVIYRNIGAGETMPAESKTNCQGYGARVRVTAAVCPYCEEPIERGDEPR